MSRSPRLRRPFRAAPAGLAWSAPAGLALAALAGLALAARPAAAAAQEPDAQARPDTVELVDRVVAVVGDTVLLYSEVLEALLQMQAEGAPVPPPGTAARDSVMRQTLATMVNQLVLLEKAAQMEDIRVSPELLDAQTNNRIQEIRNGFPNATAFAEAVTSSGRTLVQFRQFTRNQIRAQAMIQQYIEKTRDRRPPVAVTEEEVQAYFDSVVAGQVRPTSVAFEQIAIEPVPTDEAKEAAREKAEQALREIREGEEFEIVARRYSDDPGSREQGGDLGWVPRGRLVPAFENAAWAARTGTPIGPVWSRFGWHIIRVDNVRGGERKLSHILVRPEMGPADEERARARAEAVADSARAGVPFADLATRHGMEEIPFRIPRRPLDQIAEGLGEAYGEALADPLPGDIVGPFASDKLLADRLAYVVIRVSEFSRTGEIPFDENTREEIRAILERTKAESRFLEELRNEIYVDLRW